MRAKAHMQSYPTVKDHLVGFNHMTNGKHDQAVEPSILFKTPHHSEPILDMIEGEKLNKTISLNATAWYGRNTLVILQSPQS